MAPKRTSASCGAIAAAVVCAILLTPPAICDDVRMTKLSDWFAFRDSANAMTETLTRLSLQRLEKRRQSLPKEGDRDAWLARQKQVSADLHTLFQPMHEGAGWSSRRRSTNAIPSYNVTGVLQRPTFNVTKIVYETRPGFFATGVIYTPVAALTEKVPGVLFTSGHTEHAFRANNQSDDDYQIVQLNLVARGFAVVAFDPIGQGERFQYVGGPSFLQGLTDQHEYLGRQLHLNGIRTMSFWLWEEQFALDILASLPYVDDSRLGVAGCSGGGTQASYIASVDERIAAASIACYMSTFRVDRMWARGGGSDAEQSWPGGVGLELDKPDLLQVRAPRPTQILVTTDDTCFPAQGGRDAYDESLAAFSTLASHRSDDVGLVKHEAIWHHGYVQPNREALSAFFCAALNGTHPNCTSSKEIAVPEFSYNDLQVTSTGQISTDPRWMSLTVYNFSRQFAEENLAALAQRRSSDPDGYLSYIRQSAASISGYVPPSQSPSWDDALVTAPFFLGSQNGISSGQLIGWLSMPHTMGEEFVSKVQLRRDPDQQFRIVPQPESQSRKKATQNTFSTDVRSSVGVVEKWLLPSEGRCMVPVTIYHPAGSDEGDAADGGPRHIVVLYGTSRYDDTKADIASLVLNLTAASFTVAVPDLCGFGEVGDAFVGTLGKGAGGIVDMAQELNRTVPGMHAAEMERVRAFLEESSQIGPFNVVATVAFDQLHTALALARTIANSASKSFDNAALVKPMYTFAAAATSHYYNTDYHFSWIFGVLQHFELQDLLAAANMDHLLVVSPTDSNITVESNTTLVENAFSFCKSRYSQANKAFVLDAGSQNVVETVMSWIRSLL